MGLDVGDRTIGIALSDPDGIIASPFTTIRRSDATKDLAAVQAVMKQQDVGEIVIGLPRSLSGELLFQAERTQRFIDELKRVVVGPVHTWDERFSTAEAERALLAGNVKRARRSEVIDQTAAALILQGFLASKKG